MKLKALVLFTLAVAATAFAAMPTKQELKKVEGLVQDLMQPEMEALKAGRKNRAEVAKAAVALVEEAQSDAARLLLLKGAFSLYTAHGAFDEALEVLKAVKATVPDISSQYMAGMVESALRNVPKSKGGQLYRVLETMRSRARRQEELKAALARSAKRPALRSLHVAVAECHACLGDWPKALDEFAKGDNTMAAAVARAEKGEEKMSQKAIADFWWSYATLKDDVQAAMRRHAAEIYKKAIAAGNVTGLVKVQVQRRIDEVKGYDEGRFAGLFNGAGDEKQTVVTYADSSGTTSTARYDIEGELTASSIPVDVKGIATSMVVGSTVTNIGRGAFSGCIALRSVDMHNLTSVKAGELNRCFTGCPDLRRVDLSGVTTVGQYGMNDAFNGNKSLTTCLLNSLTRIGDAKAPSGLTRAFCGCTSITRVGDVDPGVSGKATGVDLRSLAAIGACGPGGSGGMANCFRDCTALKTVEIPNLTEIGNRGLAFCFVGDTALVTLSLPKLKTVHGQGLYYMCAGCTSLETVDLSSLAHMGWSKGAFQGCENLKKVYLTKLSTGMPGPGIFHGCKSLEVVDFSEATNVPGITGSTFSDTNPTFKIVVPDALYDRWIAAKHWSGRASQIVKASDYKPGR